MSEPIWQSDDQVLMNQEFARQNGQKKYGLYRQIRHFRHGLARKWRLGAGRGVGGR